MNYRTTRRLCRLTFCMMASLLILNLLHLAIYYMGPDADKEAAMKRVPLIYAIHTHNLSEVNRLLQSGVSAQLCYCERGDCSTALYVAAEGGDPRIVAALLDHGAGNNYSTFRGPGTPDLPYELPGSALGAASYRGNKEVVTLLLRQGVAANGGQEGYNHALLEAEAGEHPGIITLLKQAGAKE